MESQPKSRATSLSSRSSQVRQYSVSCILNSPKFKLRGKADIDMKRELE
jgi:hypothetical protein